MELEFDRDTITCYETVVEQTLCQEETLESIVPDACPDILRIVDVWGQVELRGKQVRENAVTVNGVVRSTVLYQPEGSDGLERMEVSLPFTTQAEVPGLGGDGVVILHPHLRSAEARALNPRKILLRVDLALELKACQPMERVVYSGVPHAEEQNICQRCFQGETYLTTTVQEKAFTFTEQVRIPVDCGQVMAVRVQPECLESKLIGNKLVFKGGVDVTLLAQDGNGGLLTSREALPFSQVMEVQDIGEDNDCELAVVLSSLGWEPLADERGGLELTLELLAQAQVRCHRPVTLLQDLYSTVDQMDVCYEPFPVWHQMEQSVRPQAVRELIDTGELVRSVLDSRIALGAVTQQREGGQLTLSCEVCITVLYRNEEEQLRCVAKTVPVTMKLDIPEGLHCTCMSQCQGEVFAAPGADGVEVRFTMEFHCHTQQEGSVSRVRSAKSGEPRTSQSGTMPSLILRLATPGEGLWELAKTYGTTQEQILQANELTEEELPEGKMLLIPRVR